MNLLLRYSKLSPECAFFTSLGIYTYVEEGCWVLLKRHMEVLCETPDVEDAHPDVDDQHAHQEN